jgi:TolB protein
MVHGAPSATTGVNGHTAPYGVSADGTFAVFYSRGTDAMPGFVDHNGVGGDVYRLNLHTGQIDLVSQSTAGGANGGNDDTTTPAAISPDGRYVAFTSRATDLIAGFADNNGTSSDNFLRDMDTGQVVLMSHKAGAGSQSGDGSSFVLFPWSSDSRYVSFMSSSSDLISGQVDGAGTADVFRFDRVAGTRALVTAIATGPTEAGGIGDTARVSADGKHVTFDSPNTGYVAGFNNNNGTGWDVYERDVDAATTRLVSGASGSGTNGANGNCEAEAVSGDGRFAAFHCAGNNLVPGFVNNNGSADDAYLHDATGATSLLSGAGGSATASGNAGSGVPYLSPDGTVAVLNSQATDLVPGFVDGNGANDDLYIRDISGGSTRLLTASTAGPTHGVNALTHSEGASPDARTLFFSTPATDVAPGFTNPVPTSNGQLYRYDMATGATGLVSGIGSTLGDSGSFNVFSNGDASTVLFASTAGNLVPGFVNANGTDTDVFASYGVAPAAVASASAIAPLTAAFDGAGSSDPDGAVVQYAWNFGDGQTGSGATATHAYAAAGTYTGSLTVTDDSGNTASAPVAVTVAAAPKKHVVLKLGGAHTQHLGKGTIKITAKCNVKCKLSPSGTLTGGFKKLKKAKSVTGKAGKSVVLKLQVPKSRMAKLRKALRRHKKVTAKLAVKATATGFLSTTAKRNVKLRR